MYAIRKPCWRRISDVFYDIKPYKVLEMNEDTNDVYLEIGAWDLDRFVIVKTLKEANKIIKLIKENTNE